MERRRKPKMICLLLIWLDFNIAFMGACGRLFEEVAGGGIMVISSVDSGPRRIAPSEPHDTERSNLPMLNQFIIPTFGDLRLPPRFWSKVRVGSIPTHRPDLGSCWDWMACRTSKGYGQFWWGGRLQRAHRVAFETLAIPIPRGLQPDHLCRNPCCVNSAHIELVTHGENLRRGDHRNRRKTHCSQGHSFNEVNTYIDWRGWRKCRTCHRERTRQR